MSQHETKRNALHRLSRRQTFLLSALVGTVAGGVAIVFQLCVTGLEAARQWASIAIPDEDWWLPLALAPVGGLLGWSACRLTRSYCPEAGGSGIPHVKANLLGLRQMRPVSLVLVKLSAGLLALGAGFSLGREGPTIHLGAACSALISRWLKVPARSQKSLLAAGAGAGLAAAFNAPLAGFLFIMEELRREMSRLTYGSALVAAVTSVAVARLLLGQDSSFGLNDGPPVALSALPVVMGVGVAAALVGICFNWLLLRALAARERSRISLESWAAILGVVGTLLISWCPQVTGGGHRLTHTLLHGPVAWPQPLLFLLLLLGGKLLFTVACYATGVPGGIFAPLLTMGALTGYASGLFMAGWVPELTPSPELLAVVGMAAVLAGSVRAPLTGVVLIVEMTGRYHLLYALLLSAFVAYALAEYLCCEPIYEALLRRDLHRAQAQWRQETQMVEVLVEPHSAFDHTPVSRLPHYEDLLIALLERDGEIVIPHGTTVVQAGDILTLLVGPHMTSLEVSEFLSKAQGP